MKDKPQANKLKLLSIILVMFASYTGPGFASGTQTVSYFLSKGWIGIFIGPLVVGLLCFTFTYLLFEINRRYVPNNSKEAYGYIYPHAGWRKFFGNFKDVQVVVLILLALSANISTVGLLLQSVLGLNKWIGALIFIILLFAVASFGSNVFRKAGSVLATCLLLVSLYIGFTRLPVAVGKMSSFVASRASYHTFGYSNGFIAWLSMITILVFFMNGYDACVHASKGIVKTRRDVLTIAAGTAILTTGITMMFTVIFAAGMPGILKIQIPTLWALTKLSYSGMGIQLLYVLFVFAAALSSSMSFLFTVVERFQPSLTKLLPKSGELTRKLVIEILLVIICTIGSSFGLLNIVKYGYTLYSILVGLVMFAPLLVAVPYRLHKDKKK